MVENTRTSAFAATVSRLEELTESELRQLHLIIGVRLGLTGGNAEPASGKPGARSRPGRGGKSSGRGGRAGGAKGNPERKSQWANHPLYREYSRLKKVVESQAKEMKISFNQVQTPEQCLYREALTQWVNAKSRFRDRQTANENPSDEDSEGETEARPPPRTSAETAGSSSIKAGPSAGGGKPATPSPPSKGKEKATAPSGGESTQGSPKTK